MDGDEMSATETGTGMTSGGVLSSVVEGRVVGVAREVASQAGRDRPGVVSEVAGLEGLLDLVGLVDRVVALVVERLIELRCTQEVEEATGLPVALWLSQVARRTRSDVRMLETAADVLPCLPGVRAAFAAGELSWSQVRAVVLEVRGWRLGQLEAADDLVSGYLEQVPDASPDEITAGLGRLRWQLDEAGQADRLDRDERDAVAGEFFALQPRLDGLGGRVWGEFGAVGFATLDAAINTGLDVPATGDGSQTGARGVRLARQRAERLIGWASHHLAGCTDDDDQASAAPAKVIVRAELDTLLGGGLPAELLTTLTGGRLQVTAATARRIIDEGGAELRTVVIDEHGSVVGVGRSTRRPPGWLADATLAVSATCQGPGCQVAARLCQLDHARPWHPARHGETPGPTDIANIGRVCATDNHRKERDGWTATGTADGQRRWHHPRTGLDVHHLPDHWQPRPDPPVDPAGTPRPPRSGDPPRDPPATDGRHRPGDPPATDARHRRDGPDDDPVVADLLDPPDTNDPF